VENSTKNKFIAFSAVTSGIKQIKEVMEVARFEKRNIGRKTILFVDEIHRFNKAQQDAFLPFIEDGTIILLGATTENPSFELNSALLSRCKVFVLEKLDEKDINTLIIRAVEDEENGLGKYKIDIDDDTIGFISSYCDGDIRIAYNILELAINSFKGLRDGKDISIDKSLVENILQKTPLLYDKNSEEHYNIISALHKSLRGSDPDAAIYWVTRMLEGGEDPLYIIRRMVRFASEDIGLADPEALRVALDAKESFHFIGPPEGYLAIIQAAVYLALAPKSNSLYTAFLQAKKDVNRYQSLPVPHHIRNAPTKLMKDLGYSKGYKYPHDYKNTITNQTYMPDKLKNTKYYSPTTRGFEKKLLERLNFLKDLKKKYKG
jgi:putative ATPase